MAVIRLTKEFSFEMAHALEGYDGACSQLHGHSYRLFVTVKGSPVNDPDDPKNGMVMDFGLLKQIVNRRIVHVYDHAIVLRDTGSDRQLLDMLREKFGKVILVSYQPTCENMIVDMAESLKTALPQGIELISLKLHETATSYAEWFAADNVK